MKAFKDHSWDLIEKVASLAGNETLTAQSVYTELKPHLLQYTNELVSRVALPGSKLTGFDNLYQLLKLAKSGASCIIMAEHYSNLDLLEFYYFLDKEGERGKEVGEAVVAIAGMKLTLDNPYVAAFASIFARLVICPSRTAAQLDPEKDKEKIAEIGAINRAATKALFDIKRKGKIIFVYPAGTRYRPWAPDSKRGVREIDTYLKSFDYMCFMSKNGLLMSVREDAEDDMLADYMVEGVLRYTVSPPEPCAEFRERAHASVCEDGDKKQAAADAIMARLEQMHIQN